MAPRGLPKDIVMRLHQALERALNDPATNDALKKVGAEPQISTPAAFAALIAKDWKTYGEAIRVANLKIE
jgi:tripartite-type tricarboxylate transporter receptor subunit TctC